jgi:uncharacterized membrane protein YhhN
MAIFSIKESKVKPVVFVTTGLFLFLAAVYFLPVHIPWKLAFPVGVLFLASLWLTPWEITLALLFSAMGDVAGCAGEILWQMGLFAVGHLFYILFFVKRYFAKVDRRDGKVSRRAVAHISVFSLCVLAVLAVAFALVVPSMPEGVVRIAGGGYAVIICGMFLMALLQRSSLYALGAAVFVISDLVLAWNLFVEPIESAGVKIMVTYYLAQWLIFVRSTPYEVPHPVRLLRF